ncbi:MAG TPA: hypothetical protein VK891_06965 [Euzebyales bacterium]|nr:hypothetical protein [Euzebyales bacterium]
MQRSSPRDPAGGPDAPTGRAVTWLVAVLAIASFVTVVLDYLLIDAWIPDAILLGVVLLALAGWTATRSTWAPAIAGCAAAVLTIGNLLSPFVNYRLVAPDQVAFFVTTWAGAIAGVLAAPVGVAETLRRRRQRTAGDEHAVVRRAR